MALWVHGFPDIVLTLATLERINSDFKQWKLKDRSQYLLFSGSQTNFKYFS